MKPPRFCQPSARDCAKSATSKAQNVTIEYRWAEFQYERLAPMAADLVRHVTAIAASAARLRRSWPRRRPRRFRLFSIVGIDPVEFGLVTSLSRPGGNMTGIAGSTRRVGCKAYRVVTRNRAKGVRRRFAGQPKQPLYRDRNANIAGRRAFSRT